jgi:hypothetical protein
MTARAGVFVGVDRYADGMPQLYGAVRGARDLYTWAVEHQGLLAGEEARLVTDKDGPVTFDHVYRAVREVIGGAGVEKLLIFFAGHGVVLNHTFFWLLSDFPGNPNAAVHVTRSAIAAWTCGVPHVVFISDACRMPAGPTQQLQTINGGDLLIGGATETSGAVDQFFACGLGRQAVEAKTLSEAADGYEGLYTTAVRAALLGEHEEAIVRMPDTTDVAYVRVHQLRRHLAARVPALILERGLRGRYHQLPDAQPGSENEWVSELAPPPPRPQLDTPRAGLPSSTPASFADHDVTAVMRRAVQAAAYAVDDRLDAVLAEAAGSEVPDVTAFASTVRRLLDLPRTADLGELSSFLIGPESGIVVLGPPLAWCDVIDGTEALFFSDTEVVFERIRRPGTSAVVEFVDGSGAVVPVLPEHLTVISCLDGALVDVGFEPHRTSLRAERFGELRQARRPLHAVLAAATLHGRLHLDRTLGAAVVEAIRLGEGVDAGPALHVAHALAASRQGDLLAELGRRMRHDLGTVLYDVELLRRDVQAPGTRGPLADVLPFVPLAARTWGLLPALDAPLPPRLENVAGELAESPVARYPLPLLDLLRRPDDPPLARPRPRS